MGKAPDEEFTAFCRSEYPRLVGSLGLFCGELAVAEELAQEALMRAWRDWGKVARMASPGAWVHTVALNLARSHYRRKRAERRAIQRLEQVRTEPVADAGEAAAARRALANLPARQKTALLLRYYVDLPIFEVADAMNCSPTTAKGLLRKALETLRRDFDFFDPKEASRAL